MVRYSFCFGLVLMLLIVLTDSSKGLVVFFPSDKTNTFESNKP